MLNAKVPSPASKRVSKPGAGKFQAKGKTKKAAGDKETAEPPRPRSYYDAVVARGYDAAQGSLTLVDGRLGDHMVPSLQVRKLPRPPGSLV